MNETASRAELHAAFQAGFAAARTRGDPNADLRQISKDTASRIFGEWYERNDKLGRGEEES